MIVQVKTDDGVVRDIKPSQLMVNGVTLEKVIANFNKATKEFAEFKMKVEKRERELLALWDEIK